SGLPTALAAGIGLGMAEQLLLWNYPRSGLVEAILLVVTLAVLALQSRRGGREEEKGSWAAVEALRPLPESLRRLRPVRNLGVISGIALFCMAAAVPFVVTNADAVT